MPDKNNCPQCGTPLPFGALAGLCPACLLKMGAAADTVTDVKQPAFAPPSVVELAVKFPQLEILELIGKGGMGAVYKARQKQLDRIVALKILPPGIGDDPAFAERFTREAKALAKLNHPNIVTLYEFGDASGQFYFLMEFVDGVNLRQLLAGNRMAPREALAIVPQICDALQFAHDQGIVHRDIKPENILLDRRGRVKVADFGLAKIVGNDGRAGSPLPAGAGLQTDDGAHGVTRPTSDLTDAGKVMGTPQYMSPEQIQAPGEVDHRADIYALGVVFYQMLTGELPGKKLEAPSKKVSIDVRLDEIVLRALEKKPELRYQQVSDVKTMVETIASTSGESPQDMRVEKGIPVLRWRDRWIWDTQNVTLMFFVPFLLSAIAASILVPRIGPKGWLAILPAGMGMLFGLINTLVGKSVRGLKARLPKSDAEVAEALIFERPRQTPGIAVLHADRLELFGIAMIDRLEIPLAEIATVSEVRMFNGKLLWWKRGFVLDLKNGRRIGVAVPEPFGRRWRARLSGGALKEIPGTEMGKSEKPARSIFMTIVAAVTLIGAFGFAIQTFSYAVHRDFNGTMLYLISSILLGTMGFGYLRKARSGKGCAAATDESRFSRMAIVGAICLALSLIALLDVVRLSKEFSGDLSRLDHNFVTWRWVQAALLGLVLELACTSLGWTAVAQIRRSAGKISGMWLAVFDGLLFPLLALDALVVVPIAFHASRILANHNPQFYIPFATLLVWLLAISLMVWVDWLIIRRVWRAVNITPKVDALPAIEAWLALMDKGDYAGTWRTASPGFRMVVSEADWAGKCVKARKPLGNVLARQLKTSGGTIFGRIFKVQFATRFAGGFDAVETVQFSRQPDGSWKAITYIVRIGTDLARDWKKVFWIMLAVLLLVTFVSALGPVINQMVNRAMRQNTSRPASKISADFHYRVFEADATLVDRLIPSTERKPGVQPGAIPFETNIVTTTTITRPDGFAVSRHGNAETDSQLALIDLATLDELLAGIAPKPGVLVNQTRTVTGIWWPRGTTTVWNYSRAENGHPIYGSGAVNLAYFIDDVRDKVRIEGWVRHNPNYNADGNDLSAKILYDDDAAQAHALAFLIPFIRKDNSAGYLVAVYEISPRGSVSTQPAAAHTLAFGPVVERVLPCEMPMRFLSGINLDSGRIETISFGTNDVPTGAQTGQDYFARKGVDMTAIGDPKIMPQSSGLNCTLGTFALPAEASDWDNAPASLVLAHATNLPSMQEPVKNTPEFSKMTVLLISEDGEFPKTYVFHTRTGSIGLLQITGFTDNPRGVKLRYKLVQAQPSAALVEKMLAKRAARDEFQLRWVAAEGDTTSPADLLPFPSDPSGQGKLRVLRDVVLSSDDVESAGFSQYQSEQKRLEVFLRPRGRDKFAQATAQNIHRQLAIIWRGNVICSPIIQSEIPNGRFQINGRFTDAEAQQLLDWLNDRVQTKQTNELSTSLAEPPSLQFLAWQDEWQTNPPGAARHPDGTPVTDAMELKWLKAVFPGGCKVGNPALSPEPRFLQLWFSHPLFDEDSLDDVALLDVNGRVIPPSARGNEGSNFARTEHGQLGEKAGMRRPTLVQLENPSPQPSPRLGGAREWKPQMATRRPIIPVTFPLFCFYICQARPKGNSTPRRKGAEPPGDESQPCGFAPWRLCVKNKLFNR